MLMWQCLLCLCQCKLGISLTWSSMCPPLPPSPPSGPAVSLHHSWRNEIAPSPPFPPIARTLRISTKYWGWKKYVLYTFLGTFAMKYCKNTPISFAIIVCKSPYSKLKKCWTDFHKTNIGEFYYNLSANQFWLKSDNSNRHFTWKATCTSAHGTDWVGNPILCWLPAESPVNQVTTWENPTVWVIMQPNTAHAKVTDPR